MPSENFTLPLPDAISSGRFRPTWVEIAAPAFRSNLRTLRQRVGPSVQLLAVLKADAYGHGASFLAPIAVEEGAAWIGVSSVEEGLALRASGLTVPLLILGSLYPLENFTVALQFDLTPTVASLEAAHRLADQAKQMGKKARCYVEVDTGMGRFGVSPAGAERVLEWIARHPFLDLLGLYTHFSSADTSRDVTLHQLRLFEQVVAAAHAQGLKNLTLHAANSAALLSEKKTHLNMVRPGLSLYGITMPFDASFTPVLSWKSTIVFIKHVPAGTPISYGQSFVTQAPSDIATLPVGYADGVPRSTSGQANVLIHGRPCPIVGRVTMDHMMVDVTGLSADVGDEAVLIGQQQGASLSAVDWAGWANTIPYEILCGISKRVPRVRISE